MKAHFLKLAVLTGLLALGAPASATSTDDAVTASQTGFVHSLGTINATYSDLYLAYADGSLIACESTGTRHYIARAHARHQLMYDVLLAAKLSGRMVEMHYQLVGSQCWVKRVILQ
jgi:hypothetical protein